MSASGVNGDDASLYIVNVDGTDLHLIAHSPLTHSYFAAPTWSPNGDNIAVGTNADNPKYGGELDIFQPFVGTSKAIVKVRKANVFTLGWQPLPTP